MAEELESKKVPPVPPLPPLPPVPPPTPPLPGGLKPPLKIPKPPMGLKLPPKGELNVSPGFHGVRPPVSLTLPAAPPMISGNVSRDLDERFRRMEEQAKEAEESKKKMERLLYETELKLKDEKEKALYQAMKAREEESLSLKMEQSLKEMQDKSRVARREQELDEARARAEEKVKDLERRLNEERETWVINLKKQMELRDSETNQVETQLEMRFRDLERRWLEEKSGLTQTLKSKEDELDDLGNIVKGAEAKVKMAEEEAEHSVELARREFEQELKTKEEQAERDVRYLKEKLDVREREQITLKAHMAMIETQVRAAQETSSRTMEDKERSWQAQLSDLQKDFSTLRQQKDQLQMDYSRASAETTTLRKEITEAEKRCNLSEQRFQELKFQSFQTQEETARKLFDLNGDRHRLMQEVENFKKKIDEQLNVERALNERLKAKEKEVELMSAQMQNLNQQKENEILELAKRKNDQISQVEHSRLEEKNSLEKSFHEAMALKDKELKPLFDRYQQMLQDKEKDIAGLKVELSTIENKLERKFERERVRLLDTAGVQLEEEIAKKTDIAQKQLLQIRESVSQELALLEDAANKERAQFQEVLAKKESELGEALEKLAKLDKKLFEERVDMDRQISAMRIKIDEEREERDQILSRSAPSQEDRVESELEAELERNIQLAREQEEGAFVPAPIAIPSIESLNLQGDAQPAQKVSWTKRFMQYLGKPVIEIDLEKKKDATSSGLEAGS